jgi:hypothetical protein
MFENLTVFILGAGASWHYGYPTGEDLVKEVKEKAGIAADYFRTVLSGDGSALVHRPNLIKRNSPDPLPDGVTGMKKEWADALRECEDLIERLAAVDPLVIDYFLRHNPHLSDIGRFCVAWVLLEREADCARFGFNVNRREQQRPHPADNWCRFVIHKLATGCWNGRSLLNNKVTFVTFNYDVSLEYQLYKGLSKLAQFSTPDDLLALFFAGTRFLHIYGKIRDNPLGQPSRFDTSLYDGSRAQPGPPGLWRDMKALFDTAYAASKSIRTIAPYEKALDIDPTLEAAKSALRAASCIYILGYGFDPFNSELLNLRVSLDLERTHKTVMFTNFGNRNVINKNASRVLFGTRDKILSNMPDVIGHEAQSHLCERSVRNVYDALAYDFEPPEEHPLQRSAIDAGAP